jgi:hypothetical protein
MIAPGVTGERVVDIDQRITALQQRIADARARIDAHVKQAEALLGESR